MMLSGCHPIIAEALSSPWSIRSFLISWAGRRQRTQEAQRHLDSCPELSLDAENKLSNWIHNLKLLLLLAMHSEFKITSNAVIV